jgi:hypothetical protein
MNISDNRYRYACYLVIACAILARLPYLTWPLFVEPYRETQTAMTIWAFGESGHISLFNYETPIFGPPWRAPLELPIFQIYAYALKSLFRLSYDAAAHLAGLSMFCLSAYLTKRICEVLIADKNVSLLALVFYVISPYSHRFSTACLIEYCAVSCCLGYVLALALFLKRSGSYIAFLVTIVLGVLAYSVKITTLAGYIAIVLAMVGIWIFHNVRTFGLTKMVRSSETWKLVLCLLLPLACGYAWVAYSDSVKMHSGYGAKWSSASLSAWNFGTWGQRLDLENWRIIYFGLVHEVAPYAFAVLLAAGLIVSVATKIRNKTLLLALAAGLLIPICIFFNLYIPHPYYFIALTPIASIFVALGSVEVVSRFRDFSIVTKAAAIGVLAVSLLFPYYIERRSYFVKPTPDYLTLGRFIGHDAPKRGTVFLAMGDYTGPAVLYYAKRRGLLAHHRETVGPYVAHIKKYGYSHLVCANELDLSANGLPGYHLVTNLCGYKIYSMVP